MSAYASGFISTAVGSPLDVVKTRLSNLPPSQSTMSLIKQMAREEGLSSFYKGFFANFMRIGSWGVGMFLTMEQLIQMYN